MSLDILLLIATIVVAVAAVFASLLQAVLERRASRRRRGPRKVDAQRLARAVPPPVRVDASARAHVELTPPKPVEAAALIPVMAPTVPAAPEPALTAAPEPALPTIQEPALPAARESVLVTPPPSPVAAAPIELEAPIGLDAPSPTTPTAPPAASSGRRPASAAAASLSMVSASAPPAWIPDEPAPPDVPVDPELAYRIGVAGVRRPSRPAVLVVAGAKPRTVSMPGTVATEAWPEPSHRRRRAAFRIAAVAVALAWVMTAVVVLPDLSQQGGVLGETGRPGASDDGGVIARDTPTTTASAGTPEPSPSPTPDATPTPSPTPSPTVAPSSTPTPSLASTGTVQVAEASTRPGATSSPDTPTQTAGPTRTARPSRPPLPSAAFTCTTAAQTLSCAATVTDPAASYFWDFSEGDTEAGAHASHLFAGPGQYLVTLTVRNAWGSRSSSKSFKIS